MSSALVAIFFGAGVGAWVYAKLARSSGNADNSRNFLAAGFVAFFCAFIVFTLLKFVFNFD